MTSILPCGQIRWRLTFNKSARTKFDTPLPENIGCGNPPISSGSRSPLEGGANQGAFRSQNYRCRLAIRTDGQRFALLDAISSILLAASCFAALDTWETH